jgi:hypothetical protein
MDPYLEEPHRWGGVHMRLIVEISKQLNRALPKGVRAEVDQYVSVQSNADEDARLRNPDVFIPEPVYQPGSGNGSSTALLAVPTVETILLPGPTIKHRRVLIQTNDGRRVLTAIEVLSPSNKEEGDGRDAYLAKRSEYLGAGTNLVEIDLLRSGPRLPFGRPQPPVTDYYIIVSPAAKRPRTSVWACSLRFPIPTFPVPVSDEIPSVPLDLTLCLRNIYEDGRYEDDIDYSKPAVPPLNQPDAEWAAAFLPKPSKKRKK